MAAAIEEKTYPLNFVKPKPKTTSSAAILAQVATIIHAHKTMPGAMLPILHAIQDTVGHIPADAVPLIADQLRHL